MPRPSRAIENLGPGRLNTSNGYVSVAYSWLVFAHSLTVVALILVAPPALAWTPDPTMFANSDTATNLHRVPEDGGQRIQALLRPLELDSEITPGTRLQGITLERFWIELQLQSDGTASSVYLLAPGTIQNPNVQTPSFQIATDGVVPPEALAKIVSVLKHNDTGKFWPRSSSEYSRTKPREMTSQGKAHQGDVEFGAMEKADVSHLWGDLLASLFVILSLLAAPGIWRACKELNRWDWLAALLVFVLAAAWRWAYAGMGEAVPELVWEPQAVLPPSLRNWVWFTLSRFTEVTPASVSAWNMVLGSMTAPLCGLGMRLILGKGGWGAMMAGLFVACWPLHIRLSGTPSLFVGFALLSAAWVVGSVLYARSGSVWVHLWAVLLAWSALFCRPEAPLVLLPLLPIPWMMTSSKHWFRPAHWIPQLLLVVGLVTALASTGETTGTPDPYLPVSFALGSWLAYLGIWVFSYALTPLPVLVFWAAAIAARPWRGPYRFHYWTLAIALFTVWAVYSSGECPDPLATGRTTLVFLVPLVGLAGLGAEFLSNTLGRRANLVLGISLAALVFAPLWHWSQIARNVPFHLVLDFLL